MMTVFLGVGVYSHQKTLDFMSSSGDLLQIHQTLEKLENILRDISEAKGYQRDFIMTGEESYLQSCQESLFLIDGRITEIRKLIQGRPEQQQKLDQLNSLLVQEINFFKKTVEARRQGGLKKAVQLIQRSQGTETLGSIYQVVVDIQKEETDISNQQTVQQRQRFTETTRAFWSGFSVDLVLLILIYILVRYEMSRRLSAERILGQKSDILRLVQNNMADGVMAVDLEGRFLTVNPAAENLLGFDFADMPPLKSWPEKIGFFQPDGTTKLDYSELPLVRAFSNQELFDEVVILRNKKNPYGAFLLINGGPLKDNNGKIIGGIIVWSDITEKKKNERIILGDIKLLKESLTKSERHNDEISTLANLVESLQVCLTVEEVAKTSASMLHTIFPETSGRLLVINNSKTEVQSVSDFGKNISCKSAFPPEECWALRRSQAHLVNTEETALLCQHLQEPFPKEYVCVPLAAQSKLVGMIHVSSDVRGKIRDREKKLAGLIGEQIALALANLRLRETLKNQSIRDVVTGLFNRRYLEEALEREIGRIERSNRKLAVLMLDIDHFKQFNDKFGHESGDRILFEIGSLLNNSIRKGDTACRYGGEEMVLLFPETGMEEAKRMAEKIRELVKTLKISHLNTSLGLVTISIGVALFPDDGKTALEVLRTADLALYHAKHTGRDRVVCSTEVKPLKNEDDLIPAEKAEDSLD